MERHKAWNAALEEEDETRQGAPPNSNQHPGAPTATGSGRHGVEAEAAEAR
jgi:hypothetical protein